MKKSCELCSHSALMYCQSDNASLCYDCDRIVHSANFLVAKHSRTLLCHKCQSPTPWIASGVDLGLTASLCVNCLDDDSANRRLLPAGEASRRRSDAVEENTETEDENGEYSDESEIDDEDEDEDEDEDGENQVVPLSSVSSPVPATASSSSSSSEEFSSSNQSSNGFRSGIKRERLDADSEDDTVCSWRDSTIVRSFRRLDETEL